LEKKKKKKRPQTLISLTDKCSYFVFLGVEESLSDTHLFSFSNDQISSTGIFVNNALQYISITVCGCHPTCVRANAGRTAASLPVTLPSPQALHHSTAFYLAAEAGIRNTSAVAILAYRKLWGSADISMSPKGYPQTVGTLTQTPPTEV